MAWGTTGGDVSTNKDGAASILFLKDGYATIRQVEIVLVTETRALTEAAAKAKVVAPSRSSGFKETTYYRTIDGVTHQFLARIGTETKHAARRADDSGQWVYTKTETTYSIDGSTSGWSTTNSASLLTAAGVSVPVSSDRTATYQYKYGGESVSATVTTNVVEYRNVTEAGKNTYLGHASAGAVMTYHNYIVPASENPTVNGTMAWSVFMHGTDVAVSARYVSEEEGWTVTKTTKVYGWVGGSHWKIGSAA